MTSWIAASFLTAKTISSASLRGSRLRQSMIFGDARVTAARVLLPC
jgi:hypothetical protein